MITDPGRVLLAGDWHLNPMWGRSVVEYARMHGCDVIVQVGDFGFWHEGDGTDEYLDALQAGLEDSGIILLWLDGNHEDHERLIRAGMAGSDMPVWTAGRDRIWYLPRGYRWTWWGKTWMSVGGAVSVDKSLRKAGWSWFPEEELTDEQVEYCCRPGGVDVIVSHDCPVGVPIPGINVGPGFVLRLNGVDMPAEVLVEAAAHRVKLRRIWDETGASRLYHGHYHVWHETSFGDGVVVGLDCDGSTAHDHTKILTAEDFADAAAEVVVSSSE